MIVTHPERMPADPSHAQALWLRADVHNFVRRHHNTLKGTIGASYFALVLLPGDVFTFVAGDDPDGLQDHISTAYPEFLAAEMIEIKDEVLH